MGWHRATGIVAGMVTTLLIAIFLVYFAKPTQVVPYEPYSEIALIVIAELAAFGAGAILTGGGYRGAIVKALTMAVITAFILVYFLKPEFYGSFDQAIIVVFGLELAGLLFGSLLTMGKGSNNPGVMR